MRFTWRTKQFSLTVAHGGGGVVGGGQKGGEEEEVLGKESKALEDSEAG